MDYKLAGGTESWGRYGIGVRIEVACKHELTEADKRTISKAVDEIYNTLHKSANALDSEVIEGIAKEKEQILSLFPADCRYKEIPNGYSSSYNNPWFIVYTTSGPIEIGWRKRVINIDWTNTVVDKTAHELFPNEDVTKGIRYIHAWGYDKAREYIKKLLHT